MINKRPVSLSRDQHDGGEIYWGYFLRVSIQKPGPEEPKLHLMLAAELGPV